MNDVYRVIDRIRQEMLDSTFIHTVTFGEITQIATFKRDIYALGHISINNSVLEDQQVRFSLSVIAMDILKQSKEKVVDKFRGNDNLHEVLQEMHSVLHRLSESMRRGDMFDDLIQLDGDPSLEPFTDRFEDIVAGWVMDFDVVVPNNMSIC